MLAIDPKERVTASEALDHELFVRYFGERNLSSSFDSFDTGSEENTAFENMRQFQTK